MSTETKAKTIICSIKAHMEKEKGIYGKCTCPQNPACMHACSPPHYFCWESCCCTHHVKVNAEGDGIETATFEDKVAVTGNTLRANVAQAPARVLLYLAHRVRQRKANQRRHKVLTDHCRK